MAITWTPSSSWQDGHNPHQMKYSLSGKLPAAGVDQVWDKFEAKGDSDIHSGGFTIYKQPHGILVISSGEDALDSIYYAVGIIEKTLTKAKLANPVWQELPPQIRDSGAELIQLDGYWVRPELAPVFRRRRQELIKKISHACGNKLVAPLQESTVDDGLVVLAGKTTSGTELSLLVGEMQLDMMEEADHDGGLAEYVLG